MSPIAALGVEILIAKLGMQKPVVVKVIFSVKLIGIVSRIFIEMPADVQIAIFVIRLLVHPFAVYSVGTKKRHMGS